MRVFAILLTIGLVVLLVYGLNWFTKTPAPVISRKIKQTGLFAVGALLILLAVTGRLHWLFALLGGALPALSRLWTLKRIFQNWRGAFGQRPASQPRQPNTGQTSTINTQYLQMVLDHDSGELDGVVIQGKFNQFKLSQLSQEQLLELYMEYRQQDQDSAQVLEAYLNRRFGEEWQSSQQQTGSQANHNESEMTLSEAYSILGLGEDADSEQIKHAHRRLMQKLHPDRGGSDYLAAKVNQAKEVLLKAVK